MSATVEILTEQIKSEFLDGRNVALTVDTPLIDNEIIDSLGIFLLLGFIKDHFGVEVEPENVSIENFSTIGAIARLIESNS